MVLSILLIRMLVNILKKNDSWLNMVEYTVFYLKNIFFAIKMVFAFARLLHRKPDNILNASLRDICV